MKLVLKYFPNLSHKQKEQFTQLKAVYEYWNSHINIISRKTIHRLYTNHVLHSLAIAKVLEFTANTKVIDVGTGGGFPGIPLAILFPKVNFLLVDSIGKKIKVVDKISNTIKLKNIRTMQERVEDINETFDFVVSRAVTNMFEFTKLVEGKFNKQHKNNLNNGILYLKGGELSEELKGIPYRKYQISDFFEGEFFETKKVIYIGY